MVAFLYEMITLVIIQCRYYNIHISRPRFEDDEEIVEAFTEYDEKKAKLNTLYKELERLQ